MKFRKMKETMEGTNSMDKMFDIIDEFKFFQQNSIRLTMNNFPFSFLIVLNCKYNSLQNRVNELHSFISKNNKIDIILIREVCKNPCIVLKFLVANNNLASNSSCVGSAFCVKHHITHYIVQNTTFTGLDNTKIVLQFPHIRINFISLYVKHSLQFSVTTFFTKYTLFDMFLIYGFQ